MNRITPIIFLLLIVLQSIAYGQDIPPATKDTTALSGKIEEVTVTAFRSPYNLFNIPAPVNLLAPFQFEMGNSLTPVEALNQTPGVLMHHATLNTNRLTIRGIGSRTPYSTNKIKAYFGEIPLTTGDGETTLEDLENSAIHHAEIIKGPSSSLYGAGIAGVILFQPKTTENDFVQNQSTFGSFGTFKNIVSAGVSKNKINVFALASLLSSDGYRDNDDTKRSNFLVNSTFMLSKRTMLQVLLKATKMKAYIPSSLDLPTYRDSPKSAAANWKGVEGYEDYTNAQLGVSFNYFTNNDEKISTAIFGSFRDAEELRPFNTLEEFSNYAGARAYAQKIIANPNSSFVLTTGFEFFREKYNWTTSTNAAHSLLSDNRERRQYENLFFQMEANFSEIYYLSAGANGNLTHFYYTDNYLPDGDKSRDYSYKPIVSPRLGINVVLSRKFSVFGNVSQGFSTPTFEETLLPEGKPNTDIKPETGWSTEIGFRSQLWGRIQFSANYFRVYVKNLLVARRTGEDAYVGVNAGSSLHPGLETELRWNVTPVNYFPSVSIAGNATLANYHFTDFVDQNKDYSGNNLPGTAKTTALGMIRFKPNKNTGLNVWYRFTGEMAVNDANSAYSEPFGITNAELKYEGKRGILNVELKGGFQNIFNVHYSGMLAINAPAFGNNLPRYYYPGNPRNFYLSLLIKLE